MTFPFSFSSLYLSTGLLTGVGTELYYCGVGLYPSSNPSGYLNSNSGVVRTTGNQTISGDKAFDGWLTGTNGSISLKSGIIRDNSLNHSIDWANRRLKFGTNVILDWYSQILYNGAENEALNWGGSLMKDGAGYSSIAWNDRELKDTNGYTAAEWGNRKLIKDDNTFSVDWQNRTFGGSWDFADSSTSSNLGTDWSVIGDTELVTKGAVDQSKIDGLIAEPGITTLTCFGGGDIQTSTSGGGTISNGEMASRNRTHNTALSYVISRHPLTATISLANGDAINFGQPLFFGVTYTTPGADYRKAGTCSYIYAGTSHTYLPSSDPSTLGFGWKIQQQTITPIFYKTSLVSGTANTSVLSAGGATRQQLWLAIYSDGAGNVSWYINGTLQYTTSAGPIAQGSTNNCYASVGVYGDGTQTSYADCTVTKLEFGKPR